MGVGREGDRYRRRVKRNGDCRVPLFNVVNRQRLNMIRIDFVADQHTPIGFLDHPVLRFFPLQTFTLLGKKRATAGGAFKKLSLFFCKSPPALPTGFMPDAPQILLLTSSPVDTSSTSLETDALLSGSPLPGTRLPSVVLTFLSVDHTRPRFTQ